MALLFYLILALPNVYQVEQPLRFQGQYHDLETGLYYNRHRYYSPDTGRYITPDPIKLAGGLNSYQYVTNPTGWVDPLGLSAVNNCPKTILIKKRQLSDADRARAEELMEISEKNSVSMRPHEAEVAVEYEKTMGVELVPAPKDANYDFTYIDSAGKNQRVDFMYTDYTPERVGFLNLYFVKGKPTAKHIKAGNAKKDPNTGAYYSDDPDLIKVQVDQMKDNIDKHVNDNKADVVPMDLRNLTLDNRQAVKDYVNTLPPEKQSKVVYIED